MPDHYMYGAIGQRQFELLSQLYDGEVNNVDQQIEDLLTTLDADGRLDSTLVVITADHGENLGEHGHFAHVFSIYNTLLHVPLVIVPPGGLGSGVVRHETAQLLDLFPTILAWCGVEYAGRRDGRDLLAAGAEDVAVDAFSEYYYPRQVLSSFDPDDLVNNLERFHAFMKRQRALQNRDYKLIWGSDGTRELYRIQADPDEADNLLAADSTNAVGAKMAVETETMVAKYQGDPPLDPPPPVGWLGPGFEEQISDPELLRKLRSLGYVK
jgi:arylsulfatase A-like enzyme